MAAPLRPPHGSALPKRTRGSALIALLAILGVGLAVLLVGTLTRAYQRLQHDSQTTAAIAQAKDALIGYAATYRDRNTNTELTVFGYLPCPDMGRSTEEGLEDPSGCINTDKDISVIGRLPWRTLGLPPLRDGNGDCLWYAVSGNFKNNVQPKPPLLPISGDPLRTPFNLMQTDLMSSDSNGQFEVFAADGTSKIAGALPTNRAVAIIFSPGTPLAGQNRAVDPLVNAPECGGNMDVANYLDTATVGGTLFSNYLANASTYFTSAKHAIDTAANQIKQFISGEVKNASGNTIINDRLLFIAPAEIFAQKVEKRADFPAYLAPSVWVKNTAYKSGSYISPTIYNGHCYQAVASGTSAATEPTWPTNGTAVTDNTTRWRDIGVSCNALAKTAECIARYGLTVNPATHRLPWAAPPDISDYGTNSLYDATTAGGSLLAGRTPYKADATNTAWLDSANTSCPNFDVSAFNWWQNYKDQLFYAVAKAYHPSSVKADCGIATNCLTVDGNGPYAAVVLFSGKKLDAENLPTGQSRNTSADKASLLNYLSSVNQTAMAANGNGNFTKGSFASTTNNDILVCLKCDLSLDFGCNTPSLPTCAGPSQISFQSNIDAFVSGGSATGGISVDNANKTVTLAPGDTSGDTVGCFWYPSAVILNGRTLRAYYEFSFANRDTQQAVQFYPANQASSQYGYGFTFAVLRGDAAIDTQCGTAPSMGMANGTMNTPAATPLDAANVFVETDIWSPGDAIANIEQPYVLSGSNPGFYGNHVSVQQNSSTAHAANAVTETCNAAAPSTTVTGCFQPGIPTWLEYAADGMPATGTIRIGNSGSNTAKNISGVTVNGVNIINTTVIAATGTNTVAERTAAATALAAAINSFVSTPDYVACAGTTCSPSFSADTVMVTATATGTAANGYAISVTSPGVTAATSRVAFSASASGAKVSSVTVNGVEILNDAQTAAGGTQGARNRDLANKVCTRINSYPNINPFEYTAAGTATGATCPTTSATFYIQAPVAQGATPNGYPIVIASSGTTVAIANGSKLAGGVTNIIPVTTTPLAGGSNATLNQRVEIKTRCNSTCTTCDSALGTATYMRVKVWEQCTGCNDTTVDFATTPTINTCIDMTSTNIPSMDNVQFGFTGGSTTGANSQGATIKNFTLTTN